MEKLSLVQIMQSECCHNHKNNCETCPVLSFCEDGRIHKLIRETENRDEYVVEIDE